MTDGVVIGFLMPAGASVVEMAKKLRLFSRIFQLCIRRIVTDKYIVSH